MKKLIPYGRQYIDKSDIQKVASALSEDRLTTGEIVFKFEKEIAAFVNSKYSVSCNSGTSALFIAKLSASAYIPFSSA